MRVIFHNLPQKFAMLLLAIAVWYLVSLNDTSTSQKSYRIPLEIEGILDNQIVSGAPTDVEIVVSGPSKQIDRLKEENFGSYLDFNGASGNYDKRIRVNIPQGLSLISVSPETAIGTVEQISNKVYPVSISLLTPLNQNYSYRAVSQPTAVEVNGRESVLAKIDKVVAIVNPKNEKIESFEAQVIVVDKEQKPLPGLSTKPPKVQIELEQIAVLHNKTVKLVLEKPLIKDLILDSFQISQKEINVVGKLEDIEKLEEIKAKVDLDTPPKKAGTYNVGLGLELPQGVKTTDQVTVELKLSEPVKERENDVTTNPPLRRPDPAKNQQ